MGKNTIFSIPPELRIQIYRHVFPYNTITPMTTDRVRCLSIDPPPLHSGGSHQELPPSKVLALLLVNRQMLKEAAAVFYGKIRFANHVLAMPRFIKGIGRTRANLLTNLLLLYTEGLIRVHNILRYLRPLEGLQIVRIWSWYENFDGLKDELVRAGILNFTGKFDFEVLNTQISRVKSGPFMRYETISSVWSCRKGASEWKEP